MYALALKTLTQSALRRKAQITITQEEYDLAMKIKNSPNDLTDAEVKLAMALGLYPDVGEDYEWLEPTEYAQDIANGIYDIEIV